VATLPPSRNPKAAAALKAQIARFVSDLRSAAPAGPAAFVALAPYAPRDAARWLQSLSCQITHATELIDDGVHGALLDALGAADAPTSAFALSALLKLRQTTADLRHGAYLTSLWRPGLRSTASLDRLVQLAACEHGRPESAAELIGEMARDWDAAHGLLAAGAMGALARQLARGGPAASVAAAAGLCGLRPAATWRAALGGGWELEGASLGALPAAAALLARDGGVDASRAGAILLVLLRPAPEAVLASGALRPLLALLEGSEDAATGSMAAAAVWTLLAPPDTSATPGAGAPSADVREALVAGGAAGALLARLLASLRKLAAGKAGLWEAHDVLLAACALRALAGEAPAISGPPTAFAAAVHAFFHGVAAHELRLFAGTRGLESARGSAILLLFKAGARPEPAGEPLNMLPQALAAKAYSLIHAASRCTEMPPPRPPPGGAYAPVPPAALAALRALAEAAALKIMYAAVAAKRRAATEPG
jgi:hypothetical protein